MARAQRRGSRPGRARPPHWGRRTGAALLALAAGVAVAEACVVLPPRDADDLCAVFAERPGWFEAARSSYRRWGVPEPVQLAVMHQESRFFARARPPRERILGILPAGRRSSAYGYGQVKDGTWQDYRDRTERAGASRDDFADVADFIGWYGDVIHRAAGVAKTDAYRLYLAYHEGPSGFREGSHADKPWLLRVARKVAARAARYRRQYEGCRTELARAADGFAFF